MSDMPYCRPKPDNRGSGHPARPPVPLRVLAGALLLLAAAAATAGDNGLPGALTPYEAEYQVTRGPITLGRAVTRLQTHHLGWQYETVTTATGIAAVLMSGDAIERTLLETHGDGFRPLHYYQDIPTDDNGRSRVRFNWYRDVATIRDADGHREVEIRPGMFDPQSAMLVLMAALADGGELPAFDIIDDDGDIKSLGFTRLDRETIDVPYGRFDAVRVRLVRDDRPKRETIGWFTAELDWIPVRLEQRDRGKLVARLELRALDGHSPEDDADGVTPRQRQTR